MASTPPAVFHLSFHVNDLHASRHFYSQLLGCQEGRSTETWVDFDFFGHQLSLHAGTPLACTYTGQVDGVAVPMPHFGAVLPAELWQQVAKRLEAANTEFIITPQLRYAGQPGEQHTMFLLDPGGNAIELKSMTNSNELFQQ